MYQVETRNFLSCFPNSEMSKRIQEFNWSKTSLGSMISWPLSLQNAVVLMLSSGMPMVLAWGDEQILLYNDAYAPLLVHSGRHPDALGISAPKCWPEIWHQVYPIWDNVKNTGNHFTAENKRFLLKRDSFFEEMFFSLSIAPLRNDELEIQGLLITCFDTTEKVRGDLKMKQELSRFQVQLEEYKQNLSVRDEFMSIASHDLKSPLTALKLQTQTQKQLILKKDPRGFDKDRVKQFSEIVDEQVGRLNRMVDDMLEIGRIRRGKIVLNKQDVELGRLVRDSIESVRTYFSERNFPIVETNQIVKGFWDAEKIKQVVANLLINAVRFGELNPIYVKVEKEGEFAKITVSDNGIGIAPEYLDIIFERYERVAPKDKTSGGHGLFLTKKIVELHNGKIWVESSPGKGSTFFVTLPC